MNTATIRSAADHADLHACVDLQALVWGLPERDLVPFNQLLVAHLWGGQVLVAEDGGRIVGFSYGLVGRQYGRHALLSHMLAVHPDYRGQGLGVRLKLAQGRWARENGYHLITWTFDPLETLNAGLNIARLGGVVRQYLTDHYGELNDGLNRGLPTDRLLVEWHLRSRRVAALLDGAPPPRPPVPLRCCAVPESIQQLKRQAPQEALRWRLQLRAELQAALAEGYAVTSFADGQYGLTPWEEERADAD